MSSFAAKRKARKITVHEDDDDSPSVESLNPSPEPQEPALQATFKSRKPFKQSSLRKTINFDDEARTEEKGTETPKSTNEPENEEDDDVIRPTVIKPGKKKFQASSRQSSSKLTFKSNESDADDGDGESPLTSSRKAGTQKREIRRQLAAVQAKEKRTEQLVGYGSDDRPRYSKEDLAELQSATPNAPQDLSSLQIVDEDEMSLDPSELEGAMIVDSDSTAMTTAQPRTAPTAIPTEAEIREKKERRARIAKQKGTDDFIALSDDDDDDDERRAGDSYLTVLSRKTTKKKSDTRLVAEDEDLGEGFDEFVEDGGLALGRKAEREARKRQRAEIASLISGAQGAGSDGEAAADDSEAEREAAFEAAQARAATIVRKEGDSLSSRSGKPRGPGGLPRMTPLPDLSVCAANFKAQVAEKAAVIEQKRAYLAQLEAERQSILARKPELQTLLNEAGERYRALMSTGTNGAVESNDTSVAAAETLLDQFKDGPGVPGERGLESL